MIRGSNVFFSCKQFEITFYKEMALAKNRALIPVIIIGIGAVVSHFLPSFVKPKKQLELIPETQEWKKTER